MACALEQTGGEEVSETVRFVRMMDRFFDCVNVNNFNAGKKKRKPFQCHYTKGDDEHHSDNEGTKRRQLSTAKLPLWRSTAL